MRDVRTIELALERHALGAGIRAIARLSDGVPAGDHVHYAPAIDENAAVRAALGRAVEAEHVLGETIESFDGHAHLGRAWIVLRAEDDIDVRALAEADRLGGHVFRQAAFTHRDEELREVSLDPRKRDLGLGVTEACVV